MRAFWRRWQEQMGEAAYVTGKEAQELKCQAAAED
jgi:hypothetical protein